MSEEQKQDNPTEEKKDTNAGAASAVAKSVYGERQRGRGMRRNAPRRREEKEDENEQRIIDLARVTRVMAGGKRMRFRACVAVGNKKGKVAIGIAKGADVTMAVSKAATKARKHFINVPIVNDTIPHEIYQKVGAAKILFKPARRGSGIIAGGAVRMVVELSGIKNITAKTMGTGNKINNAKCVIKALESLKRPKIKEKKSVGNVEVKSTNPVK